MLLWGGQGHPVHVHHGIRSQPMVSVCMLQLCPTLCDPMNCTPPDSSVHGDSPSKNIGVAHHALLQKIFPTQGSKLRLLCLLCSPPLVKIWRPDCSPGSKRLTLLSGEFLDRRLTLICGPAVAPTVSGPMASPVLNEIRDGKPLRNVARTAPQSRTWLCEGETVLCWRKSSQEDLSHRGRLGCGP